MKRSICAAMWLAGIVIPALAQEDTSGDAELRRMISLSEVVVRSNLDVQRFIRYVKDDTSFYKAFKNLRILSYTSLNDIRMRSPKGKTIASLNSKTRQIRKDGCRSMEVLEEKTTGNMRDGDGSFNYYTASLYASLFFTEGSICGENNIVGRSSFSTQDKSGIDKRKEQLKMLFFNPGKKISGIPLMGDKSNIFDPDLLQYYHFSIDAETIDEVDCYLFRIKAREDLSSGERDKIVYDEMNTWFNRSNLEIVGRDYSLSYNAGAYRFNVHMKVRLKKVGRYLVPVLLQYNGFWNVIFKKKENGVFTATLYDFKIE